MANRKKKNDFIGTEDFIGIISERARFTKLDVKSILGEIKILFEECIDKGVDIDLVGLIHVSVREIEYTKPTGIIGYHGKSAEDFKRTIKKVQFKVPRNMKDIVKKDFNKNSIKTEVI
jgi:hypothetical protein